MDTGEDVDFWGGESPWSRLSSPSHGQEIANNESRDEDDDDDEEDSEDEDMSEDDDVDEDETDEYNRMEIFGHR